MDWYSKFEKLREIIGDDAIISNVQNYFCSDDLDDFCDQMITDYDLEYEFEKMEKEEDSEKYERY